MIESPGSPAGAVSGTRYRVARMTCAESRMPRGMENRRSDRAEGTPPTTRFESRAGVPTLLTNELNRLLEMPRTRPTLVPSESNVPHHRNVGPPLPRTDAKETMARESALIRRPYARLPESELRKLAWTESSEILTLSAPVAESTTATESPVVESIPPARCSTLSTLTERTSESVNGPARSARVVLGPMFLGRR